MICFDFVDIRASAIMYGRCKFAKCRLKQGLALIPRDPGVIVSCSCGRKIETMKSLSDVENAVQLVQSTVARNFMWEPRRAQVEETASI